MGVDAAIELRNITKRFGSVVANNNVCLTVNRGEILSILGENGSGKTTLMNMISGIYFPDEGRIFIDGEEVMIRSPKDAFRYRIGMIHQHFKLVECFTVLDNIILGAETCKFGFLNKAHAREKVNALSERYGLHVDLDAKIEDITVGMILRATEGDLAPAECVAQGGQACMRSGVCPSHAVFTKVYSAINNVIDGVSLCDLIPEGESVQPVHTGSCL